MLKVLISPGLNKVGNTLCREFVGRGGGGVFKMGQCHFYYCFFSPGGPPSALSITLQYHELFWPSRGQRALNFQHTAI